MLLSKLCTSSGVAANRSLGEEMDCTWQRGLAFSEGSAEKIQCICFRKVPTVVIHSGSYRDLRFFAMYQ